MSNECFIMLVVLTLSNLIGHVSWKSHVKSDTNIIYSFCSNTKTKHFYPFSHIMALRYRWYVTDGIRARVETLGPIWAHNAPTYFVLELMIELPCDNRNQQVNIVLQYRYLQMYQTQIFIDLIVVHEKVEHESQNHNEDGHYFCHIHTRSTT